MIDRFDEITQLRAMERTMTPGGWWNESGIIHAKHPVYWTEEDHQCCHPAKADIDEDAEGIAALRTAAPWLLEVAGCFQSGDGNLIYELISAMDAYFGGYYGPHKAAMHRLILAAKIMEEI